MIKTARGFPPVIDARVETLILGSFPGVASLKKSQYYGHPQNHFWRLVGTVIGERLPEMDYERRLETLLEHGIGLWDIIDSCVRPGSLDANIREARHNDFERVTKVAKQLRRVCFNGKTSGKMEPLFVEWGFETVVLPSSSPANTMSFTEKLKQWRQVTAVRRIGRKRAVLQSLSVKPTPHAKC
ncbi:MAG: DNA-deoxyinosine glycosylase [Betaproteobacteria bacterium]|nr:DNA-deoxyinosine glycosylase [Betaproteobacteria bacterium]